MLVAPAPGAESRLGLVVSRRVGRAHQRNRVKRLLREYFRVRRGCWAAPLDLVVIAKPGAALLPGTALAAELDAVLAPYRRAPPSRA